MKKLLYLFLVLPLIFSSCKKEEEKIEGCMDSGATNYNPDATEQNNAFSCMYAIAGYVWETSTAILNGENVLATNNIGGELHYFWNNGDMGTETYDLSGNLIGWGEGSLSMSHPGGNTNLLILSGTFNDLENDLHYPNITVTIDVDVMTNATNMTWRYVNYPTEADTYVKTLVRSTSYSLSDWK